MFSPIASTPTAWRLLADVDERALASLRSARASAREVTWLQAAEQGEGIPAARAAGRTLPGLVLDLDATLITCHSEKQQAAPTYKGGFGFHPLLCFLANTGEAPAGQGTGEAARGHVWRVRHLLPGLLRIRPGGQLGRGPDEGRHDRRLTRTPTGS